MFAKMCVLCNYMIILHLVKSGFHMVSSKSLEVCTRPLSQRHRCLPRFVARVEQEPSWVSQPEKCSVRVIPGSLGYGWKCEIQKSGCKLYMVYIWQLPRTPQCQVHLHITVNVCLYIYVLNTETDRQTDREREIDVIYWKPPTRRVSRPLWDLQQQGKHLG